MPSPQTSSAASQCRRCHATLSGDDAFCAECGARAEDFQPIVEELRNVRYLLKELARWEAQGVVNREQAATLHESYAQRENELSAATQSSRPVVLLSESKQPRAAARTTPNGDAPITESPLLKRTLFDTASDPHTLRLLLYTGAGMLVVGVVIWLRDALYLKLQEPIVQASLLALSTFIATATGWLTTLRTRQRLTGRALTLIGSLLVPVNFWFLVRSGLISSSNHAWIVCALCALLYTTTAALLGEKLYVYLASAASVATIWAIIFRAEREAFGLYALTLMIASLALLHLSRLFSLTEETLSENSATKDARAEVAGELHANFRSLRWTYDLWGAPFVHMAFAGAIFCALCYMPLRLWLSPSLYDGVFRLRANTYDPSVAMLLFVGGAYIAWFAGRFIYTKRRAFFYACSALALCWTEFLMLDALRISRLTSLLMLSLTALALSIAAHFAQEDFLAKAFHRAGLFASTALALASLLVALIMNSASTWTHSTTLFVLAAAFAIQSAPRFCNTLAQKLLAHAAILMFAVLVALHMSAVWFAAIFMLLLFMPLLRLSRFGRERKAAWLESFSFNAAAAVSLISFTATLLQAAAHLQTGDALLYAPAVTALEISALLFAASRLMKERARANYFRAGLLALILSYSLWCLRAGYSFIDDLEIYTTPVAVLLLFVTYFFVQHERRDVKKRFDASALLWIGSALLCAPLCWHAFGARLVDEVPAPWRDLALLCASLALILFGVISRLRAPASIGGAALLAELLVLTLTSVDWAQVPLKIYLVATGALIVFVCWCLEFRREQLLLVRKRINERRVAARERFGEWR